MPAEQILSNPINRQQTDIPACYVLHVSFVTVQIGIRLTAGVALLQSENHHTHLLTLGDRPVGVQCLENQKEK